LSPTHERFSHLRGRNELLAHRPGKSGGIPDRHRRLLLDLASAFKRARRSILINGWQLDSRFRLFPSDAACPTFGER